MLDEYGLTAKQRRFADYYIETGNAAEAARKAGYSPKNADVTGRQNIVKPTVKAYIAQRMQPAEEKRIATADEVLQFLTDVMMGRVKDQFGLDASLQDRTNAAKELMKRYAVADMRQQSTMARLDSLFVEFRAALDGPPQPPPVVVEAVQPETDQDAEPGADGA